MTISMVQVLELVGNLYEAALDATLWPKVVQRCAQALDADCNALFVYDFTSTSAQVGDGGVMTTNKQDFKSTTPAACTAHYNILNLCVENELKISFMRLGQAGAYCPEEKALWQTVMRHLQRAIELHQQVQARAMGSEDCLAALDLIPQGIVLLNAHGQIEHISRSARSLLTAQRGLYVDRAGTLHAASSAQNSQLQRLVRGALKSTPTAGGGALQIQGSHDPLHLFVTPLLTRSGYLGLSHTAAAIFITDPHARPPALPQRLCTLYGMTPAEARLTAELVAGRTLHEYAEQAALSLSTVRTQLKSAAAKADVKRQADLIRVVLTGPAVLRAYYG